MTQRPPTLGCAPCKGGIHLPFPFSMAFQPIVDVGQRTVYAYEALVRGVAGESAYSVLSQVTSENRYAFDQSCRVKAISLASRLGLAERGACLSINFMPGAVYSPVSCLQVTLKAARDFSFPPERLILEVTEDEKVFDRPHLRNIVASYRSLGLKVALDDFGAGYSGLNLLADFPPDIIKLDMALTRGIGQRPAARAIVAAMVQLGQALDSKVIVEGVETVDEYTVLRDCGAHLMQGYLFAKPGFESLPDVVFPD